MDTQSAPSPTEPATKPTEEEEEEEEETQVTSAASGVEEAKPPPEPMEQEVRCCIPLWLKGGMVLYCSLCINSANYKVEGWVSLKLYMKCLGILLIIFRG